MNDELEMNNRCEYPAGRVLADIFELLQDMAAEGFCHTTHWRSHCAGDPLLCVDLWPADSEHNVFGEPKEGTDEIAPIVSSTTVSGFSIGWCIYSDTDFGSLNRLYDTLATLMSMRCIEKNLMSKADLMALALAGDA